MTTPAEKLPNPVATVIGRCADAIATAGGLTEHLGQYYANADGDAAAADLHRRAAVTRAKHIRSHAAAIYAAADAFIEAADTEKPRIVRA